MIKMKSGPQKVLSDGIFQLLPSNKWEGEVLLYLKYLCDSVLFPIQFLSGILSCTVVSSEGEIPFRMQKLLYCSEFRS